MATEPKTGLTLWDDGILQPDLLFNALLYWAAVWAQPVILSFENAPPGSPADGDMHLVGTGTGSFTGHDDELAYWDDTAGAWVFFAAAEGYMVHNLDDATDYRLAAGVWTAAGGGGTGDVVGPASAVTDTVPLYDGTTGKLLKAGGKTVAQLRQQTFAVACSDLTTNLTTGTGKAYFYVPYDFTVTEVQASVDTMQTAGSVLTIDINESGTTILSTKITIDNSEGSSITAATPPVISDATLTKGNKITVDIDQVGTAGAKGLIVYLIGYPT